MDCNQKVQKNGTAPGTDSEREYDHSWDVAKRNAMANAATDAAQAAFSEKCPAECPRKRLTIELDPPSDPKCEPWRGRDHHRWWFCTSECAWRVTIECVKTWHTKPTDLTPDGFGGVEEGGDGDGEPEHRRVRCRERVKFDGTSQGTGGTRVSNDANGTAAQEKALTEAEGMATVDAAREALKIRCPFGCHKRRLIVTTKKPEASGTPDKVTRKDAQGNDVEYWDARATCEWRATLECLPE